MQIVDPYDARKRRHDLARKPSRIPLSRQARSAGWTRGELVKTILIDPEYFDTIERSHGLSRIPGKGTVRRLRRDSGWLQNRDRLPAPIRHVPDPALCKRDHPLSALCISGKFEDYCEKQAT
jgi:hypothetical protein